jgi:hypothetical protein
MRVGTSTWAGHTGILHSHDPFLDEVLESDVLPSPPTSQNALSAPLGRRILPSGLLGTAASNLASSHMRSRMPPASYRYTLKIGII